MIDVQILPNKQQASQMVADMLYELIATKPDAVIGVATGSTPEGAYEALAKRLREEPVDTSQLKFFALDEYVGIDYNHPESYHQVIKRTVTDQLGVSPQQVHVPEAPADATPENYTYYDEAIKAAGGIDIQLLGIGRNGHIGFNEPGTAVDSPTHVGELTEMTREDNARFFDEGEVVPPRAITQGIGTILKARKLVLMAFGEAKRDAIADTLQTPADPQRPGSALQLHDDAVIFLDEEAAAKINNQ